MEQILLFYFGMPRKKIELSGSYPYHIMNRSNESSGFPLPQALCWQIFCDFLFLVEMKYEFKIHLFVLMRNHYHLIASTPKANLSTIIMRFQTEVAQSINNLARKKYHVFGGQYKPCIIKSPQYYVTVYKYVLRNPVKANLCKSVEEYKYSSLHGLLGQSQLIHPISPFEWDSYIPEETYDLLSWANTPYRLEESNLMKSSLRKKELKFSKQTMKQNGIKTKFYMEEI